MEMDKDLDRIIAEYIAGESAPEEAHWLEERMLADPELKSAVKHLQLLVEIDDFEQGKTTGDARKQFEAQIEENVEIQNVLTQYRDTEDFLELEKRRRAIEKIEKFEIKKSDHLPKQQNNKRYFFRFILIFIFLLIPALILFRVNQNRFSRENEPIKDIEPNGKIEPVETDSIAKDTSNQQKKTGSGEKPSNPLIAFYINDSNHPFKFPSSKGTPADSLKSQWILLYQNKKYKELKVFLTDSVLNKLDGDRLLEAKLALGLSSYYSEKFTDAQKVFQEIIDYPIESIWNEDAKWFSAKCFIMMNERKKASGLLDQIRISDSKYRSPAEKLKNELSPRE
ncbi:MAG TPA: hypothetical protein PKB07_13580 [Flavilitoribacter sp.]|nr:hypothetical protein [Flavilitoribacter sp.]